MNFLFKINRKRKLKDTYKVQCLKANLAIKPFNTTKRDVF